MTTQPNIVLFHEVQKPRQWWILLIVFGVALLMWVGFVQQIIFGKPFGTNPGPDWLVWLLWLLFGIGFPIAWFYTKLVVELTPDQLSIRYVPLASRVIPLTDIKQFEARKYSPIKEYGGWGPRYRGKDRLAYNVSGNQGVELELHNGQKIMIGSQKSQALVLALEQAMAT